MMIKKLIDFFDVYDSEGQFHNGFLQSIDMSVYTDISFLNELTLNIMDGFLHNEIGNMLTSARWSKFLEWDKESKTYKINADFYTQATTSIYAYLLRGENLYTLTQTDFRSLSAQETEMIVYGQKEEIKNYDKVILSIERENDTTQYGAEQRTLAYGVHETDTDYGQNQRTLAYGAHETDTDYGQNQRTLVYGQTEKTNVNGARSETNTIGAQTNTSTNINQTHPYDMQTFLDNTKDERTDVNGTRSDGHTATSYTDTETNTTHTDTDTVASHKDTVTDKAHTDTDTIASRKDTVTDKAHSDTDSTIAHTDTNTYGDVTNTTDEREDKNTIKTHTDTKTRTKVILIPPEKYFDIQKELLQHNIYDIMKECVKECFTIHIGGMNYEY